ncbi:(4Fe-4S)-binding protein [Streptomyces microflavus]|uniref:(4Fe-4S)-binding protein n=1 Tax=Streptomyces microflavus TaxID=1919 RepID=UPI0033D78E9F
MAPRQPWSRRWAPPARPSRGPGRGGRGWRGPYGHRAARRVRGDQRQPTDPAAARSYDGEGITVSFDAHRCLHAAECVRGLPAVFEVGRKPWILTGCCTCAGTWKSPPPHGPHHETRVMLCGCGATRNTPYCDHSGACARHDQGAEKG